MFLPAICPCMFLHQFKLLASVLSFGNEFCCWAVWRDSCSWYWIFDLLIPSYCPGATEDSRHTTVTGAGAIHVSRPSSCHSNGKSLGQFCDADRYSDFPMSGKTFDHTVVENAHVLCWSPSGQLDNPLSFLATLFLERCFQFQHFITRKTLMNYSEWRRK